MLLMAGWLMLTQMKQWHLVQVRCAPRSVSVLKILSCHRTLGFLDKAMISTKFLHMVQSNQSINALWPGTLDNLLTRHALLGSQVLHTYTVVPFFAFYCYSTPGKNDKIFHTHNSISRAITEDHSDHHTPCDQSFSTHSCPLRPTPCPLHRLLLCWRLLLRPHASLPAPLEWCRECTGLGTAPPHPPPAVSNLKIPTSQRTLNAKGRFSPARWLPEIGSAGGQS